MNVVYLLPIIQHEHDHKNRVSCFEDNDQCSNKLHSYQPPIGGCFCGTVNRIRTRKS